MGLVFQANRRGLRSIRKGDAGWHGLTRCQFIACWHGQLWLTRGPRIPGNRYCGTNRRIMVIQINKLTGPRTNVFFVVDVNHCILGGFINRHAGHGRGIRSVVVNLWCLVTCPASLGPRTVRQYLLGYVINRCRPRNFRLLDIPLWRILDFIQAL